MTTKTSMAQNINPLAVLFSIHPYYCQRITTNEKWIELRKKKPSVQLPFKGFIYCTKVNTTNPYELLEIHSHKDGKIHRANGKIIGEFICNEIHEFRFADLCAEYLVRQSAEQSDELLREEFFSGTCTSFTDTYHYCYGMSINDLFYGIVISDFILYEKPKELSEFSKPCRKGLNCESCALHNNYTNSCGNNALHLRRPPQSWCYVLK